MNERMKLLEAVAEAARADMGEWSVTTRQALQTALDALAALDALPAPTPGETVEVYGVIKNDDGVIYIIDHSLEGGYAGHVIANVTARVPLPTVPSVTADVEVTP